MKIVLWLLLALGLSLGVIGLVLWTETGFRFDLSEFSTVLAGTKPWHIDKDSPFVLIAMGFVTAAYSAVELNLKRWEK